MDLTGLDKLAESGLLGLLLAISVTGNIMQYRATQKIQEDRIKDLKEARNAIVEPMKAIKQSIDLIFNILNNG